MEEIQNLLHKKLITKNDFYNLLDGTQIPSFYAKPKTHKTYQDIPTFRHICNRTGSCSVCMSQFIYSLYVSQFIYSTVYIHVTVYI